MVIEVYRVYEMTIQIYHKYESKTMKMLPSLSTRATFVMIGGSEPKKFCARNVATERSKKYVNTFATTKKQIVAHLIN